MVNQECRDHEESQDFLESTNHQPDNQDPSAKPAQEEQPDHADKLDHQDLRVKREHPATTEMLAI
jgi:hypothetical protein